MDRHNLENKNSKELEKLAAEEREKAVRTAHEINEDLSPGAVLDRYYFHGTEKPTLTGFLERVKDDPVPGALVGAALAWTTTQESRHSKPSVYVPAMDRLEHEASLAEEQKPGMKDTLNEKKESLKDSISEQKNKLMDTVESGREKVRESAHALKDRATRAGSQSSEMSSRAREQAINAFHAEPLINIALGFSLGAALGAMVPMSYREEEMLSPVADQMRDQAMKLKDQASQTAQSTFENITRH